MAEIDASFFRVRFDRLTPAEKNYLRAMAALGSGPHGSGDVVESLGRKVNSLGPVRSALIEKGMVYSPDYCDTAFTVPLFDQSMRLELSIAGRNLLHARHPEYGFRSRCGWRLSGACMGRLRIGTNARSE